MAKEGSTVGGLMDTIGTMASVALQYGMPLEAMVDKFKDQRFEPSGFTRNPDIPIAKSLVDYVFRWMGYCCIPGYRELHGPKHEVEASNVTELPALPAPKSKPSNNGSPNCGSITRKAGTCEICPNCAWSGGCG